ncbi:MAG: PAS domain-containing protein [Spirochaetales bacterium]|nr:PAS domain-containing protein [Spirochaetales bacterium]
MAIRLIPKGASLHTKLMLTLALFITLSVAIIASLLIEHERQTRYLELEERADRMADLVSHSVAYSVWNVDLVAMDKQLSSLATDPEIVQCTITAVGFGKLSEVIKPLGPLVNPIVRIQDINFATIETGEQKIGEVQIVLTRALVEKEISSTHRTVWVLMVVILAVMYIATFLLLRRVVSAPVNRLEVIVDRIALGDLESRCTVESGDELGRLAMRVNTMADRLCESDRSLRDSEKRLQLVLDGSQLGYWDWNIETGEVIRNARWAEMLGYTLEEVEYSIKQWTDLHHPDDRELAWKSINDHLEGRTPVHEVEYRMRTKDGQYKWILDQAKLVSWDDQGKPLRMCGTHRDITERKLADLEREKLQNQLAQAQKMESVGQLAGGVAHDFNNMLSVILGYTELALEQVEPSSSMYHKLQEIYNASRRSADITKQLLAFARKQTIEPEILDLNTSLENILLLLRRLIGENITLSWLPGEGLGQIKMDPSQLDQLLTNLCINSRDAIAGVGKITVETDMISFDDEYCEDHPGFISGDYILLAVSDDGCGMDKEILLKIFEPFFTTKEIGQGTGLGLATVYGIVKQNDGFINVYSEPDFGTTFNIYLPVYLGISGNSEVKPITDINMGGTETILIVEDDAMVLKMSKTMLERLGYTVLTANAPGDAIKLVESNAIRIHLIITDVIMQDMNGRDLAEQLRIIEPESKILFMSGYTSDIIAHRGILDKGICFIHKPFSIQDLAVKVREALELK